MVLANRNIPPVKHFAKKTLFANDAKMANVATKTPIVAEK
jgi:hypothetical protein